jgi:hypothetical protein
MGSTSRIITCRLVALGDFLYICIVIIQLFFCLFLVYGRVIIYVIFFTVEDVK